MERDFKRLLPSVNSGGHLGYQAFLVGVIFVSARFRVHDPDLVEINRVMSPQKNSFGFLVLS